MAWFIPRNKKWYARLASLSMAMRLAISIGLLLIIAGLWYYLLYSPLQSARAYYQMQLLEIQNKKRDLSHSQELLDTTRAQLLSIQAQTSHPAHTAAMNQQDTLLHLVSTARAKGLTVNACDLLKKDTVEQLTFNARGSYEHICNFFQTIAQENSGLSCDQLDLAAGKTGQLQVRCTWILQTPATT